jgi:hypothetical protein
MGADMAVDKTKVLFKKYVDAGADLAESVKRNIVHEGVIDDETVLRLNDFITAANAMADLNHELTLDSNEEDSKLN